VKGGHCGEDTDVCVDLLYDGHSFTELPGPGRDRNTHGGVTPWRRHHIRLAHGMSWRTRVASAKRYSCRRCGTPYPLAPGTAGVPLWRVRHDPI